MMLKKIFKYMLDRIIKIGSLIVEMPDGEQVRVGQSDPQPLRIRIHDESTLRGLCLNPDLAVGESYMNGTLTIADDDLHGFLALVLENLSATEDLLSRRALAAFRTLGRGIAQYNPIGRSRKNVAHHYDLSDELYELFLDKDLQYSCAYFETPDDTLDEAQEKKKRHIAKKLMLRPNLSVLDIGSGWGGLGLTLANDHGCKVYGITLSSGQHRISNMRARKACLADSVTFALKDYRKVNRKFDRIVSVGMFEHVGVPHYRQFFRSLRNLLKEDGVALIHTIGRSSPPGATNPWITKYIFPGGYVPAMSEVLSAIEKEGLVVTDIEVLRLHYAETLKNWHRRFEEEAERIAGIYDERFCRMWKFYLVASEVTFRYSDQVVFQFQIARKQQAVPLTRDYLFSAGGEES